MIKAIIFDAFEVLFLNASGHFFEKYVGNDTQKLAAFIKVNQASDRGELTYEQRITGLADAVGFSKEFVGEHLYEDLVKNDQLFACIGNLKKDYRIGLLSNTGQGSIEQFISESDLHEVFDDVVLSYQVGYVKPEKEIFELAASRLQVSPYECIFIDDSNKNCEGATVAGMETIIYKDFSSFKEKLEGILA